MTTARSIDPSLLPWPATSPQLQGGRCRACGHRSFPATARCIRCGSEDQASEALATRGTLWSWTRQHFPPPSPPFPAALSGEAFRAFYLGYVELEGQLRIVARLDYPDDRLPAVGDTLRLATGPLYRDETGCDVIGYSFELETGS